MPTFAEGDRIKFHYNFGDYNNSLKTLTQTQTPNTPLVLSQMNREHPIVFRQKLQDTNFLHSGAHTHRRSSNCYLRSSHTLLSIAPPLFIAKPLAEILPT